MSERILTVMSVLMLAASAAAAQPPPPGPVGTALGLQRNYAQMKNNITSSAEKMPEADYFFKPTPDIRGYGQLWAHVADAQFGQCSGAKGVPNPRQGQPSFETLTTKAEIVKALADSYAFCDDAFSSLTDASRLRDDFERPRRPAVACGGAPGRDRARQRDVRDRHGLPASQRPDSAVHRTLHARPRRSRRRPRRRRARAVIVLE